MTRTQAGDPWTTRVKTLVESGNRELAKQLIDGAPSTELSEERHERLSALAIQALGPTQAFLAPVAGLAGTRSFWCQVRVEMAEKGEGDSIRGLPNAQHGAAWGAVEAAWLEVGGEGERPPVALGFTPPLDEDQALHGSSFALGVSLAAAGAFAQQRPPRNVLATGADGEALREIDTKVALHHATRDEVRQDLLLARSSVEGPHTETRGATRVRYVEDLREAVLFAFGRQLWSATGSWPCLHAYVDDRARPPARFLGGRLRLLPLGKQFDGPAALDQAARAVLSAIEAIVAEEQQRHGGSVGPARIDLSIGGPAVLAAAVGHGLRNRPVAVHFVDAMSNEVWWSHQAHRSSAQSEARRAVRATRRVVVARNPALVPAGWEALPLPTWLHRGVVDDVVWKIVDELGGCADLHLAFEAPLAIAFATSGVIARQQRVRLYHWIRERGEYECWFDGGNA